MIDRTNQRDCRMGGFRKSGNMPCPACSGGRQETRCAPNNGGGNACTRDCEDLTRRLQALDFSIVDTVLYLDAYPNCRSALEHYHRLVDERNALLLRLSRCGMPITIYENRAEDTWDWGNSPWPWEPSAN